jgi:hypothetical protein
MTVLSWAFVIVIGVLNIAFNVNARLAAGAADTWGAGIFTLQFLIYFIIGCTSLLALYTLYYHGITLTRAIVLMGSVSIIGGTAYGLFKGQRLDGVEWLLLGVLTILFGYRLVWK